jgi:hypothetical protein
MKNYIPTYNEFVNEGTNSDDAYTLNRLSDNQVGTGRASDFLAKHNIDLSALSKAKMQGVINKYEIRDIVNGTAHKSLVKKFLKDYVKESIEVNEAKNTIGLAFKKEQDYLDFKEFIKDEKGSIKKDFGWDSKTKSWEVEMETKVLEDIYGNWYSALPDDFESVIIESVNEANSDAQVKKEVISKLSDFFRVPANALTKFNFDGKDNIKELTKALNSTSDQGTEQYYRIAIQLAKRDLGIREAIEVNEGAVKAFEMDYKDMETSIKRGIGWIDPEYVADTWENSSDTIDFELVKDEIYNRLIKAGLLWTTEDGETKDKRITNINQIK